MTEPLTPDELAHLAATRGDDPTIVRLLAAVDIRNALIAKQKMVIEALRKDVEEFKPGDDVLADACRVTVHEMERYYRDGRHPDLSPVLRASRDALKQTGRL